MNGTGRQRKANIARKGYNMAKLVQVLPKEGKYVVQIMRPTAATLDSKDDLFDPPDARREKMPTFRAN